MLVLDNFICCVKHTHATVLILIHLINFSPLKESVAPSCEQLKLKHDGHAHISMH